MVDSDTTARRQLLDVMGPPEMANLTPVRPTQPVHPEYALRYTPTKRRGTQGKRAGVVHRYTICCPDHSPMSRPHNPFTPSTPFDTPRRGVGALRASGLMVGHRYTICCPDHYQSLVHTTPFDTPRRGVGALRASGPMVGHRYTICCPDHSPMSRPHNPFTPRTPFDTPRRSVGALRANGLGLFTATQSVAPTNGSFTQPVHPE